MRFCISAILVSLTSRGASTGAADDAAFTGGGGFLPPVSHMMTTIRNASPMRSQDWTFFGRRPCGLGAFSCISAGWLIAHPSVRGSAAREGHFLLADGEVARVNDFGCDVHTVLELEWNQVGLAVFDFIKSRFFARCALDVGKGVVVVDRGDEKRLARRFRVDQVIELQFGRVTGAEAVHLLGGLDLRRVHLIRSLGAKCFDFFLVG